MHNEIREGENNGKAVYEPPTFEDAGSFRDSTGWLFLLWADSTNPGWA